MRLHSAALLIGVAAAAVGGCRDAEGERAVAAVSELVGAFAQGDGAAACDRLAEAGVSELLLAAVRSGVDPPGLDAPDAERCAIIARHLADDADARLTRLRRLAPTGATLDGDRASVRTPAGTFETAEIDGRWRVTRLDPVIAALTATLPKRPPVHLTVVAPKLEEPALGAALAGRTDEATVDISGSLEPRDASLRVVRAARARVQRVEARDGRFRIRAALRRGKNKLLLRAHAPHRDPTEISLELRRDPA